MPKKMVHNDARTSHGRNAKASDAVPRAPFSQLSCDSNVDISQLSGGFSEGGEVIVRNSQVVRNDLRKQGFTYSGNKRKVKSNVTSKSKRTKKCSDVVDYNDENWFDVRLKERENKEAEAKRKAYNAKRKEERKCPDCLHALQKFIKNGSKGVRPHVYARQTHKKRLGGGSGLCRRCFLVTEGKKKKGTNREKKKEKSTSPAGDLMRFAAPTCASEHHKPVAAPTEVVEEEEIAAKEMSYKPPEKKPNDDDYSDSEDKSQDLLEVAEKEEVEEEDESQDLLEVAEKEEVEEEDEENVSGMEEESYKPNDDDYSDSEDKSQDLLLSQCTQRTLQKSDGRDSPAPVIHVMRSNLPRGEEIEFGKNLMNDFRGALGMSIDGSVMIARSAFVNDVLENGTQEIDGEVVRKMEYKLHVENACDAVISEVMNDKFGRKSEDIQMEESEEKQNEEIIALRNELEEERLMKKQIEERLNLENAKVSNLRDELRSAKADFEQTNESMTLMNNELCHLRNLNGELKEVKNVNINLKNDVNRKDDEIRSVKNVNINLMNDVNRKDDEIGGLKNKLHELNELAAEKALMDKGITPVRKDCHPALADKIVESKYFNRYPQMDYRELLKKHNKERKQQGLPEEFMPSKIVACTVKNMNKEICWNHVLGRCQHVHSMRCKNVHISGDKLTPFAVEFIIENLIPWMFWKGAYMDVKKKTD